jgi:hypothetical protein
MVKYMTMKADLTGFSSQAIFFLVGMQQRTGELTLESGNNIGTMLFHKGNILQASSPYSRAIGDLLVEDGLITEEDLLETLMLQKKNSSSPLGGMFLKTGKVTLEVIERMVHEQIRQSIKEFESWNALNVTFVDKDIQPHDDIYLPTREFITPESLRSAANFLSPSKPIKSTTPAATSSNP